MPTYVMVGKYSMDALEAISAKRTDDAAALVKRNGGELKAAYATLGDSDLLVIAELPDTERAIKTSVELSKLLGISFSSVPAVTVEEFDRLVG